MSDTKVYYTPAEVAERLRISLSKVYEVVRARGIGYMKIGSRILISEDDLSRYERNNHITPVKERPF